MRRVIAWVATTVDGYMEGPGGDLAWLMPHVPDAVPDNMEMLRQAGTIVLGRVTYEGFASYWPFQEGEFADLMNKPEKLVVSNSKLAGTPWGSFENARQLDAPVVANLERLKAGDGGSIVILASGGLVSSLLPTGLIDELSVLMCPVVVGAGKSYLRGLASQVNLESLTMKQLPSGSRILTYGVAR